MFDLSGMRKAGKRVANEIIAVYNEGLDAPQADPELVHEVHNMQLPLRRTTFAEVAAARRRIHDYLAEKPGDVDFNDAAALQVDLGILRREELQEKMDILDTESHILRLGTVAFATNPFELFLDFGNQIKARSYAEQTFLVQLAGGSEGYLPTEKAEKGRPLQRIHRLRPCRPCGRRTARARDAQEHQSPLRGVISAAAAGSPAAACFSGRFSLRLRGFRTSYRR